MPTKICDKCSGRGKRAYSSTSTWKGGIGGMTITDGICDKCWGTGDSENPGEDLRKTSSERKPKKCGCGYDRPCECQDKEFPKF